MNQKYDIVIPVVARDIAFLPKVVKYIRVNLVDAEHIYIVTNQKNFGRRGLRRLGNEDVTLLDENGLLPGLSLTNIKAGLVSRGYYDRPGWFLQQFIKLGFATTRYAKEYYLTWDADTLPLSKIQFFDDGHPVFTMKREYHPAYFETMERLLGYGKLVDYSFIAEHMMFKASVVRELLQDIEKSDIKGEHWFDKCLGACNFEGENPGSQFSEFETYGTYCIKNHPDLYHTQKLNTFRYAGLIRGRFVNDYMLNLMSNELDTASFELYDKPPFPYCIPFYVDKYTTEWKKSVRRMYASLGNHKK